MNVYERCVVLSHQPFYFSWKTISEENLFTWEYKFVHKPCNKRKRKILISVFAANNAGLYSCMLFPQPLNLYVDAEFILLALYLNLNYLHQVSTLTANNKTRSHAERSPVWVNLHPISWANNWIWANLDHNVLSIKANVKSTLDSIL